MIVVVPFPWGKGTGICLCDPLDRCGVYHPMTAPKPIVPKSRFQLIGWTNMLTLKKMRHSTISREPTSNAKSGFSAVEVFQKHGCVFKQGVWCSMRESAWKGRVHRGDSVHLITSSSLEPKCGGGMRAWHFTGALQRENRNMVIPGSSLALTKQTPRIIYGTISFTRHMAFILVGFIDFLSAILSGGLHIPSYLFHRCMCPLGNH